MLSLAVQLILAHIIGDFLLQPAKWVEHKIKFKLRSKYLYFHLGIHALALLFLTQFDFYLLPNLFVILVSHFLIDWIKLLLYDRFSHAGLFIVDQILHITVIVGVVFYYYSYEINIHSLLNPRFLLFMNALLLNTLVSSISIKVLMAKWKAADESENNAGQIIGMLERLFIFFFVFIDYWAGIGFLLAAKSIFRFGDLTQAKDRNLTEYILIGTLLSFGFAIASTQLYKYLLQFM